MLTGKKYTETLAAALTETTHVVANNAITLLPGFSSNGNSFSAVIDASIDNSDVATLVTATDYYPFGMEMPGRKYQSSDAYKFGYQGQFAEKDAETGFNHFEARDFDSRIGRWMCPDPLNQFWSLYLNVNNNPISGIDPTGRAAMPWYINKTTGVREYIPIDQEIDPMQYEYDGWDARDDLIIADYIKTNNYAMLKKIGSKNNSWINGTPSGPFLLQSGLTALTNTTLESKTSKSAKDALNYTGDVMEVIEELGVSKVLSKFSKFKTYYDRKCIGSR